MRREYVLAVVRGRLGVLRRSTRRPLESSRLLRRNHVPGRLPAMPVVRIARAIATMAALVSAVIACSTPVPPSDALRPCHADVECASGEVCIFATLGCGAIGTCATPIAMCTRPPRTLCGCFGGTFEETCAGPRAPWINEGACGDAITVSDATVTDAIVADSIGGPCAAGVCAGGLTCCNGACVNLQNDPLHCGVCANTCVAPMPMCSAGTCTAQSCLPVCGPGAVCCDIIGPGPTRPAQCLSGTTCPVGCPLCG
jgi:hypothetical protein